MTTNTSQSTEKTKNYSKKQEQAIRDAAPLNLDKAKLLGASMTPRKSYRSIIAKAKQLDVEYIPKPPAKKKPAQTTKADLVKQISEALDRDLDGLSNATSKSLLAVINGIQHILADTKPAPEDSVCEVE